MINGTRLVLKQKKKIKRQQTRWTRSCCFKHLVFATHSIKTTITNHAGQSHQHTLSFVPVALTLAGRIPSVFQQVSLHADSVTITTSQVEPVLSSVFLGQYSNHWTYLISCCLRFFCKTRLKSKTNYV